MTVGVTAIGALGTVGAWWLRRRRAGAAAGAGQGALTVVDEPVAVRSDEPGALASTPTADSPAERGTGPDPAATEATEPGASPSATAGEATPKAGPEPENPTGSGPSEDRPA
ncbi:MAG: hypothetical protein IRY85_19235 [Micromonosporaceae bacterium]|nr:hypothetical protein [Micromonosporaceae bacterium]